MASTSNTRRDAENNAQRISDYWARQGFRVLTKIVREPWVRGVNTPGYSVRTDMLDGLPYAHPLNVNRRARQSDEQKEKPSGPRRR